MSSKYVRSTIKSFIGTALSTENLIDLTAEFRDIDAMLTAYSLTNRSNWLGLQFIGSDEVAMNVGANNSAGCYREYGSIFLHVVAPATTTARSGIEDRCDATINAFRGQRISDIIIESISPPNFEAGATLQFESGFTSASVVVNYYRDLNL